MYEVEQKSNNHTYYYIIAAVVCVCIAAYLFCGRSTGTDHAISDTVQSIKNDNQSARTAIDGAVSEIGTVGTDITRAISNAERAEGIIDQNAGTLEECRDIVSSLQNSLREAKRILADVERTNQKAEGH